MMIVLFLGFCFLMSIQPMFMIVSLILVTLFYSYYIYSVMGSFWFGYVIVLVMLSGVLVVFTYMVSLIPNESFEVYSLGLVVLFMFLLFGVIYSGFGGDLSFVSLNLWFSYVGIFNLFLVGLLLSLMVLVVWVSCVGEGAVCSL